MRNRPFFMCIYMRIYQDFMRTKTTITDEQAQKCRPTKTTITNEQTQQNQSNKDNNNRRTNTTIKDEQIQKSRRTTQQ